MATSTNLKPGQAQFFSSFQPSLVPGDYKVIIKQTVTYPDGTENKSLDTEKRFQVQGSSQYHLPAGSVHSVYPADGESVPSRILPQVTLSDPHLPWELSPDNDNNIAKKHVDGSLIPWLALLVFTEEELKTLPPTNGRFEPSPTLSICLGQKELKELKASSVQVPLSNKDLDQNPDNGVNIIFVNSSAFRAYFSRQMGDSEAEPATARYSYLSHIRRSRSTKAQDATTDTFSIVLGHRAGPFEVEPPVSAYAHLVSLMGVSDLKMPGQSDLTALVSLYSWSFKWTKGNDEEISDVIQQLSENVRPLKRNIEPSTDKWLKRRLEAGYTMVKHRLQTGEQTMALFRGPLIPQKPSGKELDNAEPSGHGSGLQIIDRTTGIIDITYSAAWYLGRSLAIESSAFTMAISALRSRITQIYKSSSSSGLMGDISDTSQQKTLPNWYRKLHEISKGTGDSSATTATVPGSRWKRAREKLDGSNFETAMPGSDPDSGFKAVREFLQEEIDILVDDKDWYARELVEPTQEGLYLAKVLDFVYNHLLTLQAVPHNYMFPEPDILDTEAILTFYVDPLWVDIFVDGALSMGSHSTVNEDFTRDEIKWAINSYLSKAELRYKNPRIPRWGAIVCGKLLKTFDDPRVRTGGSQAPSPQLLVTTKLHDSALLLMFNCRPSELPLGLTISQAPHQQRFAVGKVLTKESIEIEPVGVPPEDSQADVGEVKVPTIKESRLESKVFNFDTRCLTPSEIMQRYVGAATGRGGSYPATGSSSLLSFALGDRVQELSIKATESQGDADRANPLEPFQLSLKAHLGESDKLKSVHAVNIISSAGSIKLGIRAVDEKKTPATKSLAAKSSAKASVVHTSSILEKSQDTHAGSITADCKVLKQHPSEDGTRIVDLIIVLKFEEAGQLIERKPHSINVLFPLIDLIDTKAIRPPKVTLFGEGSARWIAGSAYVAGDKPSFTVKLRVRAQGLTRKVNFGFLLSNVTLSDTLSGDVMVGIEEEYGKEGHNWSGEESDTKVVRHTCRIEGLNTEE